MRSNAIATTFSVLFRCPLIQLTRHCHEYIIAMPDLPPIPDCDGPQLQPYQSSGTPEITFLEEIGKGAHGHVFKVQIDGHIFALKVFNYQLIDSDWITIDPEEAPKIDEQMVKLLTAQWHPFNAECRAYARLKEVDAEHVAVRCYGYLVLSEAQTKELEDRFGIKSWWSDDYDLDTSNPDYQQEFEQEARRGLYAIVKDVIDGDVPFGPEHAPMMASDLHHLHRVGIMVHDMKEDAYVAGKLVDFSKAIVVPHVWFDPRLRGDPNRRARGEVYEDLARLLSFFREWNEEHGDRPAIKCNPFEEIESAVSRLRRGPLTWQEYMARCFNPRRIKWQKFSPGPGLSAPAGRAAVRKSFHSKSTSMRVSKRKAQLRNGKTPR